MSEIEQLVGRFFAAFGTPEAQRGDLSVLRELFAPQALIVKRADAAPEFFSLDAFIAPRAELLRSGRLRQFREWEIEHATEIFGDIAQRRSHYAKAGTLDGAQFEAKGVKLLQLVRRHDGWRLSALCWQDEAAR